MQRRSRVQLASRGSGRPALDRPAKTTVLSALASRAPRELRRSGGGELLAALRGALVEAIEAGDAQAARQAASEATRILQETLRLDEDGRTTGISIEMEGAEAGSSPIEVQATIVADRRSNSIVVTATKASLPVIESILAKLEEANEARCVAVAEKQRADSERDAAASALRRKISELHRPSAMMTEGGQPAFSSAVAPPMRREWSAYIAGFAPGGVSHTPSRSPTSGRGRVSSGARL